MTRLSTMTLLLVSAGLCGCQPYWYPEPDFGSTVNGAVSAQLQNPKAPQGYPTSVVGLNGEAAKSTIDSYNKSFDRKQAPAASSQGSMIGGSTGLTVQ